jgi:hypothetical protein
MHSIAEETLFSYHFLHIVKAFDSEAGDVGFLDLQKFITAKAQALHSKPSKPKRNQNKAKIKKNHTPQGRKWQAHQLDHLVCHVVDVQTESLRRNDSKCLRFEIFGGNICT